MFVTSIQITQYKKLLHQINVLTNGELKHRPAKSTLQLMKAQLKAQFGSLWFKILFRLIVNAYQLL